MCLSIDSSEIFSKDNLIILSTSGYLDVYPSSSLP